MKIERIADLNDPFELMAIEIFDDRDLELFLHLKEELNKSKGLLCFSRTWSNPVMWGHYAERHSGIALGFEGSDEQFEPVIYAHAPLPVSRELGTGLPKPTETEVNKLLRTKFHDWHYENEVRIFVQLDHTTKEAGLYFYEFDTKLTLREVILGLKCEIPTEKIRALVNRFEPPVRVVKSSIAHGTFSVVENVLASQESNGALYLPSEPSER